MGKPAAYLFECLIYIVSMSIGASYTVVAFNQGNMQICYTNAGVALISFVMAIVYFVVFIKAIITKQKGRRCK